jgi:hypothetical protein
MTEEFKDKIKSVQTVRKPHVEQKSAEGSHQTYHTTGRVDAQIVVPQPIQASMKFSQDLEGD